MGLNSLKVTIFHCLNGCPIENKSLKSKSRHVHLALCRNLHLIEAFIENFEDNPTLKTISEASCIYDVLKCQHRIVMSEVQDYTS